jgi:hypothetical protein
MFKTMDAVHITVKRQVAERAHWEGAGSVSVAEGFHAMNILQSLRHIQESLL